MASVSFTVDTVQVSAMSKNLAALMGQYEWIAARAMTEGVKAAKAGIARDIFPKIKGGPTNWTRKGLIARYARKDDLRAMAGFQYGEGKWSDSDFTRKGGGTPAGRYMGVNASGGDRRPRAFEMRLRQSGLIGSGDFVVPRSRWGSVDNRGNVANTKYNQILSRLRSASGAIGNAPRGAGSRGRSGKARASLDYFMARGDELGISRWQLGTRSVMIAERTGNGPKGGTGKGSGKRGRPQTVGYKRGFVPAFSVVNDAPNYERKFNIQSIAMREFSRVFPKEFEVALAKELKRRFK
jgi:hypothetical protein